jgi:PAS domain-containing protein
VLGEYIGVSRVLYGDVIDEKEVVISRDYCKGVPSIAAILHAADISQFTIDSYKSGKPVIICDVSTDPRLNEAERSAYGSIHVAANISLGLVKNGKWVAAFGAHHNEPRNWTPLEISLMEETAERTWSAVERAKTEETLLEKTRQLEVANCQKEDILESISDCFYVLDNDLRFTYVNKPAEEIWGLSRSELMGRKIEDIFPDFYNTPFHQFVGFFQQGLFDDPQIPHHDIFVVFSEPCIITQNAYYLLGFLGFSLSAGKLFQATYNVLFLFLGFLQPLFKFHCMGIWPKSFDVA